MVRAPISLSFHFRSLFPAYLDGHKMPEMDWVTARAIALSEFVSSLDSIDRAYFCVGQDSRHVGGLAHGPGGLFRRALAAEQNNDSLTSGLGKS
jgi:hypothetical protein